MFDPNEIMEVMADEIGETRFDQFRVTVNEDTGSAQRRNVFFRRSYAAKQRFWPGVADTYPNYRAKVVGGQI